MEQKLQADLPVAYSQALSAGQQLVEAAKALVVDPTSGEAQVLLHTAARGILEGTMKVVWTREMLCGPSGTTQVVIYMTCAVGLEADSNSLCMYM